MNVIEKRQTGTDDNRNDQGKSDPVCKMSRRSFNKVFFKGIISVSGSCEISEGI
jgi:hypothetical protein